MRELSIIVNPQSSIDNRQGALFPHVRPVCVRHAQAGRDNLLPQHAEVDLVLEEYVDESVNYTDLPAAPDSHSQSPIATRAAQAGVRQ